MIKVTAQLISTVPVLKVTKAELQALVEQYSIDISKDEYKYIIEMYDDDATVGVLVGDIEPVYNNELQADNVIFYTLDFYNQHYKEIKW